MEQMGPGKNQCASMERALRKTSYEKQYDQTWQYSYGLGNVPMLRISTEKLQSSLHVMSSTPEVGPYISQRWK